MDRAINNVALKVFLSYIYITHTHASSQSINFNHLIGSLFSHSFAISLSLTHSLACLLYLNANRLLHDSSGLSSLERGA